MYIGIIVEDYLTKTYSSENKEKKLNKTYSLRGDVTLLYGILANVNP